jgi:uncharacterized protein
VVVSEGQVGEAVRRDSPWWRDPAWTTKDPELREADAAGIGYDPDPLGDLQPGGLYMLYGPRRVGKTVAVRRTIRRLLSHGVEPLRIVLVSVDGWQANRLGTLYEYVTRVLTSSVREGPRYWFIDEVTTCQGAWWTIVKNLRDNTGLRDDCVVLTGSSNEHLDQAIKAFAGRRGPVADPDRALLPMTFTSFCRSLGVGAPGIDGLRADELVSDRGRRTWLDLAPYTDDLVAAWQAYLEVGGYPKAVSEWRRSNNVEAPTWRALWDVARGDAITSGIGEASFGGILGGLADRVSSLMAVDGFANDLGLSREILRGRLDSLVSSFLAWHSPRADEAGRVDRRKQGKYYFLDPLVARLPELVHGKGRIDIGRLNEQQLGVALLQWCEAARRGAIRSDEWVMHFRGRSSEIDFVGRCPDTLARMTPVEAKYVSDSWRRDAAAVRRSALGTGVLATRDVVEVTPGEPVWAVPASFIAYALGS